MIVICLILQPYWQGELLHIIGSVLWGTPICVRCLIDEKDAAVQFVPVRKSYLDLMISCSCVQRLQQNGIMNSTVALRAKYTGIIRVACSIGFVRNADTNGHLWYITELNVQSAKEEKGRLMCTMPKHMLSCVHLRTQKLCANTLV